MTLPSYPQWVEQFDILGDDDKLKISKQIDTFKKQKHFYLLLDLREAELDAVKLTLNSIKNQIYQNITCFVLHDGNVGSDWSESYRSFNDLNLHFWAITQYKMDEFNELLKSKCKDNWLMYLRAGDALTVHALYWFCFHAINHQEVIIIYSDDDQLTSEGIRNQPRFKPDWSLEHFRSTNFIGNSVVLRADAVIAAGGVTVEHCYFGLYDLLLRAIDIQNDAGVITVAHISAILLHHSLDHFDSEYELGALKAHLARNETTAIVSEPLARCRHIKYSLPEVIPLVSIIIPTRDSLELIRQCVESLIEKTTYPRLEILVVDNLSTDQIAIQYMECLVARSTESRQIRLLRYEKKFNYSAINNYAVSEASGDILCLLNNDTEVISPDWLDEMVGHLLQGDVGAVGAKLFYPDGRVQHAGDTVGPGGCANHLHSFIAKDDPGYCNRAMVAQELSAVTAACLITWRNVYLSLDGLNEKKLPIAFNDVDYCLRIRESGRHVVWTPHAELYHHESVSRSKDTSWRRIIQAKLEVRYMRHKWQHVMKNDPFYNPNFSYKKANFTFSESARVKRPWHVTVNFDSDGRH